MKLHFVELASAAGGKKSSQAADTLVLLVGEDRKLPATASALDKASGGLISKALQSTKFEGKHGQSVATLVPAATGYERVIVLGLGALKSLTPHSFETLGAALVPAANAQGSKHVLVRVELPKTSPVAAPEAAARIAHGVRLRSYRFDKYRTKEKPQEKPTFTALTLASEGAKKAEAAHAPLAALAEAVVFTRDLVSEPGNIIHPESLAEQCLTLKKLGVQVQVLGEEEMFKLGMGALLGVGQGSNKESHLVIMQWKGAPSDKKGPLAFVGKGVTFDTGGISIKPSGGMEDMKWDMGGAGAVIGLMKTLAGRKAKVNAVGVVGLVENMPDGNAQRPGDVVKSLSGQTIEVINTDAEGRLVLADALWYTQSKFKPRFMIDLATLTGAIIVSLGTSRAGLFSNDDKLAEQLFTVGKKVGEELWRLPLGEVYDKQINSYIADMQNVGEGREAGSITAAQFLQRFVNNVPWAHLDIAGMAWTNKDKALTPKGATAFGVRLLNALVEEYYEGK